MQVKEEEYIIKHENLELSPYTDSVGKLTIGVGRNLDDVGISKDEAYVMLSNDINMSKKELNEIFEDLDNYPYSVKLALIDMIFNLGKPRFLGFKKMIVAIKDRNFKEAARQAKDSKWCKQVGSRCEDNYKLLFDA